MKLSIIIPAFNVSKYICKCIDSIYDNAKDVDRNDFEIIIVDDISTDGTAETILNSYPSNEYSNLFVFKNYSKLGCGGSRNEGYAKSKGEYVWTIDGDDYLKNNAVSQVFEKIKENVDCIYLNFEADNANILHYTPKTPEELSKVPIAAWTRVYKREFYVNYPSYHPEDVYTFYLLVDKFNSCTYIDDICYHWNLLNPSALTRTYEYFKFHSHTLEELAYDNILNNKKLRDEWVPGIMNNLADMYRIRNILKHNYVKAVWRERFSNEVLYLMSGHFMH